MYKDITEQLEIQRKLEASEDCYRQLIEFLPDAIIVQNKHHIVFANPAGVKLLGKNSKSIIVRPIWDFIFSEDKENIENKLTKMIESNDFDKPILIEAKFIRFDHKVFDVEITAMPIVYNGKSVKQIQFRDITSRKNMRDV
jgi:PAS domain S-box-containing protein